MHCLAQSDKKKVFFLNISTKFPGSMYTKKIFFDFENNITARGLITFSEWISKLNGTFHEYFGPIIFQHTGKWWFSGGITNVSAEFNELVGLPKCVVGLCVFWRWIKQNSPFWDSSLYLNTRMLLVLVSAFDVCDVSSGRPENSLYLWCNKIFQDQFIPKKGSLNFGNRRNGSAFGILWGQVLNT